MSAKHAINDKLQGSVATYLRRGGVVKNQIKKGSLLRLRVNFLTVNRLFGEATSKNVIVSCTLHAGQHTAKRLTMPSVLAKHNLKSIFE